LVSTISSRIRRKQGIFGSTLQNVRKKVFKELLDIPQPGSGFGMV
jgi:hypothetical protein